MIDLNTGIIRQLYCRGDPCDRPMPGSTIPDRTQYVPLPTVVPMKQGEYEIRPYGFKTPDLLKHLRILFPW